MFKRFTAIIAGTAMLVTACASDGADAEGPLTIYSGRSEELVQPLIDDFVESTGIEVAVRYAGSTDLAATLLQEGDATEASPAVNAETGEAVSGEDLYQQNCARCHGTELQGIVGPSLIGVTDRHSDETILGILQNGISIQPGNIMPPWQEAYMYPDSRFDDDALSRIIDYLHEAQPSTLPDDALQYQTPGVGEPVEQPAGDEAEADAEADSDSDSTEV